MKLLRLDELEIKKHRDLDSSDKCFYWREYTAGKNYSYSETNQLIHNFKIPVTETHRKKHKELAIQQIASELLSVLPTAVLQKNYTFIPVPTSNGHENNDYDDRLLKVLQLLNQAKSVKINIRELIIQPQKMDSSHSSSKRTSIDELCNLYVVQKEYLSPTPEKIIIFDDIITKGAHFKAMQKTLKKCFDDVEIIGLFIACAKNGEFLLN